jgi:hypothetical protein
VRLSNVQLESINESTPVTVAQKTDAAGHCVFDLVPPGTYTLRASAAGFRTATTSKIQVEVNKTFRAVSASNTSADREAARRHVQRLEARLLR